MPPTCSCINPSESFSVSKRNYTSHTRLRHPRRQRKSPVASIALSAVPHEASAKIPMSPFSRKRRGGFLQSHKPILKASSDLVNFLLWQLLEHFNYNRVFWHDDLVLGHLGSCLRHIVNRNIGPPFHLKYNVCHHLLYTS